jgi:hypothetical protein
MRHASAGYKQAALRVRLGAALPVLAEHEVVVVPLARVGHCLRRGQMETTHATARIARPRSPPMPTPLSKREGL